MAFSDKLFSVARGARTAVLVVTVLPVCGPVLAITATASAAIGGGLGLARAIYRDKKKQ
ncbi:hypothetical protein [Photobacterium carnosum]|uniref:hypothetical protein n=1 Tax=Photobacterium carnosum TaxID=2023717 RepID=UPI001E395871|nr:hypothetical protein [Photobacterium carnosum]MCD9527535.1 hypothetical protein [Photobacterium carnosum]